MGGGCKMRKHFRLKILFLLVLINTILPLKAYAYIDPGTGSMVLQIIVASVIGLGITFKAWFYKFKNLIFKGQNKNGSEK